MKEKKQVANRHITGGGAVGDDINEKAKTPTATSTLFQMVPGVALESAHGDSKSQSDSSVFT
jgi:hypothetical protein